MSIWQISVLFAMAGCAIGCLLGIYKALEKLAKGILSIGAELTKLNTKLQSIEAVSRDDSKKPMDQSEPDTSLEDLEAAIANFEKLKRVDLTKPIGQQEGLGDSGRDSQGKTAAMFSNGW